MLAFQEIQRAFTQRIRHREAVSCPANIDPSRMKIYEDCFLGGMEENLSNCFPVLKSLLEPESWRALVQGFYANHGAKTPLFHEIPEEFLSYLLENQQQLLLFPFATELAHYEWMELAMHCAVGEAPQPTLIELSIDAPLACSPLAEIVAYHFPVHKISKDNPDVTEKVIYLCCYRDINYDVHFLECNVLTARLCQLLKAETLTEYEVMQRITKEMLHPNPAQFAKENHAMIIRLLSLGVLFPL